MGQHSRCSSVGARSRRRSGRPATWRGVVVVVVATGPPGGGPRLVGADAVGPDCRAAPSSSRTRHGWTGLARDSAKRHANRRGAGERFRACGRRDGRCLVTQLRVAAAGFLAVVSGRPGRRRGGAFGRLGAHAPRGPGMVRGTAPRYAGLRSACPRRRERGRSVLPRWLAGGPRWVGSPGAEPWR